MSGSGNTPILKVNVDTAAFDKFKKDLDDVIAAVESPVNITVATTGQTLSVFDDMKTILGEIRDVVKEIGKEFKETLDVVNDNLNNINVGVYDFSNRLHTSTTRATDSFKGLYNQIHKIHTEAIGFSLQVAKWAGLGGIVSGVFGGLGFVSLADRVSSERTTSLGLGVSTAGMQSFDINYKRFGLGDENLQKMANAKRNSGSPEALALYALGFTQQQIASMTPDELASQAYGRSVQKYKQAGGNTQGLEALGITKLYSPNQMAAGANAAPGELDEARKSYQSDIHKLDREDAINKEWTDFKRSLDEASTQIEAVFVTALAPLVPQLGDFAKGLAEILKTFLVVVLSQENIAGFKQALTDLNNYIGDKKFKDDLKDFAFEIGTIVKALGKAAKWLSDHLSWWFDKSADEKAKEQNEGGYNPIPNPDSPFGTYIPQSYHTIGGFDSSSVRRASFPSGVGYGGGETQQIPSGGYGEINADTGSRAQAIAQQLMEAGYTREQAAGVVGNLLRESSTLNPDEVGDQGQARGLAQWHPDRQAEFRRWSGHDINDPHGMTTAQRIHEQTAFMIHELKTTEKKAGDHLHAARGERDSAHVFNKEYERSADDDNARQNSASNVLKRYLRDVDIANRDQNQASPTSSTTTINRNTSSTQAVNIKVQNQTGGSAIASMSQISVPV